MILGVHLTLVVILVLQQQRSDEIFQLESVLLIQWCVYISFLSIFHLAEFFVTSLYNSSVVSAQSFLIDQSKEYTMALLASWAEFWIEFILVKYFDMEMVKFMPPYLRWLGLVFVISGYRSLVDIALIRGQSEKSYEEKELIKYSRSVKHHHDKFTKIADITTRFEDIMEENVDYGMMSFLLEVCDNLGRFGNILLPSVKCSSEIHPLVDILNPNRKPFQVFQRLQKNMVKFRNHQRKDDSLARNAEHTFRTWLSNKGYLR